MAQVVYLEGELLHVELTKARWRIAARGDLVAGRSRTAALAPGWVDGIKLL